ncbi:MAG: PP2C family protein-serine/threonine phosphatase [Patescibacteria group bacterium]
MKVEYAVVSAPFVEGGLTEDAYIVQEAGGGRPFFAAIADGHGNEVDEQGRVLRKSPTVARFAQRVVEILDEQFARFPDPALFAEIFDAVAAQVDQEFRPLTQRQHPVASLDVGAVALCLTVLDGKIHLAQAGDCRLYAADNESTGFTLLTRDHDATSGKELARLFPLLSTQTFVIFPPFAEGSSSTYGRRRLYRAHGGSFVGGLSPTRVFGDWEYQPAVTHEPEVKTFELASAPEGTLFALCSDGGNRYVEEILGQLSGRTDPDALQDAVAFTRARIVVPSDDVTIIYFRIGQE